MSRLRPNLPDTLVPRRIVDMPVETEVIDGVEAELRAMAAKSEWGSWVYYPAQNTDQDLPASREFAGLFPTMANDKGQEFNFDWVKYSDGSFVPGGKYHLDINRTVGLGEGEVDESNIPRDRITRLLVNLHSSAARKLSYLNVEASTVNWVRTTEGFIYVHPDDLEELKFGYMSSITTPRRIGEKACATEICVSRVGHTPKETDEGHFVASYSRVETT